MTQQSLELNTETEKIERSRMLIVNIRLGIFAAAQVLRVDQVGYKCDD